MEKYCVRRGNVILDVTEEELDKFLSSGYDVINEKTGEVIKKSLYGKNASELRVELDSLQKDYDKLVAENERLLEENKELKSSKSGSTVSEVKTTTKKSKSTK